MRQEILGNWNKKLDKRLGASKIVLGRSSKLFKNRYKRSNSFSGIGNLYEEIKEIYNNNKE